MKIYIGNDHAGTDLKKYLIKNLNKHKIINIGTDSNASVDYPDFAKKVSQKVAKDKGSIGILVCGSGTGMVIAANKIKGIRATLGYDNYSVKMSKIDNDSNVLCLRSRGVTNKKNLSLVKLWLKTEFSKKVRHKKRVDKLNRMGQ